MNKKIKILLAVSLLANILLIGFVAGGVLDMIGGKRFSERSRADLSSLPDEVRDQLDAAMKQAFEQNKPLHDKIRAARKEAVAILQADPFDERAFEAKIDELFGYMGQMGRSMTDVIKDVAQKADPEHRAVIARTIMRGPPRDGEKDCAPAPASGTPKAQ